MKLDIKSYIATEKELLKERIQSLHRSPRLLIVQVGNDSASNAYIKGKIKDAEELGIHYCLTQYPESVSEKTLQESIYKQSLIYDGVIIQEPIMTNIKDKQAFLKLCFASRKDVDGFLDNSKYTPCTPKGIVNYLKKLLSIENFRGKVITVVGRGFLVGRPLIQILNDLGATTICCNSATSKGDLRTFCLMSDIIITATGQPNLIDKDMLRHNADTIIIDAGIYVDENGKLQGDCNKEIYNMKNIKVTPVPGGVGLLTRLALMENVTEAAYQNLGTKDCMPLLEQEQENWERTAQAGYEDCV